MGRLLVARLVWEVAPDDYSVQVPVLDWVKAH